MLLSDIRDIRAQRPESDRIGSAELASILGSMDERPWSEWGRSQKPITASALSRLLSPFGILSGTRRAGGETFKGYLFSDFEDAFASYLPHNASQTVTPAQSNNDGHCDAFQTVTREDPVTLLKSQKPSNDGHCDVVTVATPPLREKEGVAARRCAHCNQAGNLLECHYGDVSPWLHRHCIDAWTGAFVGDIPPFLDRRNELQRPARETAS